MAGIYQEMKTFTVAFITGRTNCELGWFQDSLARELDRFRLPSKPPVIVVDSLARSCLWENTNAALPKPSIWQGEHRILPQNWWGAANARNTAIALCETSHIAFFDDRCVLLPGYLDALQDAMEGNYIMAGGYEKRVNMTVEDGTIRHGGTVIGQDSRLDYVNKFCPSGPFPCPGGWLFGANFACPTEWLLAVNGVPEICDGSGMEDVATGLILEHAGYPIKYDKRAMIVEDRTPELCGPVYRREDKGVSPNDKSHALLAMFTNPAQKTAIHTPGWNLDLRQVRADALQGKPWPTPPAIEYLDWFDGQPIREFK